MFICSEFLQKPLSSKERYKKRVQVFQQSDPHSWTSCKPPITRKLVLDRTSEATLGVSFHGVLSSHVAFLDLVLVNPGLSISLQRLISWPWLEFVFSDAPSWSYCNPIYVFLCFRILYFSSAISTAPRGLTARVGHSQQSVKERDCCKCCVKHFKETSAQLWKICTKKPQQKLALPSSFFADDHRCRRWQHHHVVVVSFRALSKVEIHVRPLHKQRNSCRLSSWEVCTSVSA